MRYAELSALQRKLAGRHKNAAPSFELLKFEKLPGLQDMELRPQTGFLSICGGTGTGKTALLEALYFALSGDDDDFPPSLERLEGTLFSVNIGSHDGNEFSASGEIIRDTKDKIAYEDGVQLVTLQARTLLAQDTFLTGDIAVLKEGISPTEMDASAVAALNLVCRKKYSSIFYYEVEISPGVTCPFFEIQESGIAYDSRTMSTGELSSFYLAWSISTANPFSCILIEEPEAYLPPVSHRAIAGLISKYAIERKLGVVVTTHSGSMAMEMPERSMISLRREGESSIVLPMGEERRRSLRRLGVEPSITSLFIVEDRMSASILNEILARFRIDEYSKYEIIIEPNGASAILQLLERIPVGVTSVRIVGALDGDQRQNVENAKLRYPAVLLPFVEAAEGELLEAIEKNVVKFAEIVERSPDMVDDAMASSTGEDHHDRLGTFSRYLGLDDASVTRVAMTFWLQSSPKNRSTMDELVEKLIELLN